VRMNSNSSLGESPSGSNQVKDSGRGSVAEGSSVGPRERKRDESSKKALSSESKFRLFRIKIG
jgi:hypothetical protein